MSLCTQTHSNLKHISIWYIKYLQSQSYKSVQIKATLKGMKCNAKKCANLCRGSIKSV